MANDLIEERILGEKVRLFYRQGWVGGVGNILVAIIVAVLTFRESLPWFSLIPFAAVTVSQTARLWNVWRFNRPVRRTTAEWARSTVRNSLANGTAWGLMSGLTYPWASTELKMVMMVAATGLTAAAVATLAPMRKAFIAYLVPLVGSMTIATAVLFPRYSFSLAFMLLLFIGVMISTSRSQSDAVGQSFRLSIANAELLESLMTAKKLADEARVRAEAANVAKSEFLARMSHEIRTPLNGILGVHELLLSSNLGEDERRFSETAHQSGRALLGIINDVLDFSKIEAGKVSLELAPFRLERLLEELMAVFAIPTERKGVVLSYALDPAVPETVRGDEQRLRQVLTNLIGNAIKFTPTGEICVDVKAQPDGKVELSVKDSGVGVDASSRARIFESFEQADGSISRRFGGTGLGLAISRQLVSLMGGTLDLDSEPGKGSRFFFSLALPAEPTPARRLAFGAGRPAVVQVAHARSHDNLVRWLTALGFTVDAAGQAPPALQVVDRLPLGETGVVPTLLCASALSLAAPPGTRSLVRVAFPLQRSAVEAALERLFLNPAQATAVAERGSWSTARVLLVDDDAVNRTIGQALLRRLGCTPDVATGGAEALEALGKGSYDLVLMDCEMPDVDGLTATRTQRAREASSGSRRTPVVALTAYATEVQRRLCLEAGMNEMVTKPLSLAGLDACLARWIPAPVTP